MSDLSARSGAKRVARWAPVLLATIGASWAVGPAHALASGPPVISELAGTGTAGTPTAGPATSSALDYPNGVTGTPTGGFVIADDGDNRVLNVSASGTLAISAGTGSPAAITPGPATSSALHTPADVAEAPDGDIYIADEGNYSVEKITPSGVISRFAGGTYGNAVPGPVASSPLKTPTAVAVDSSGNVYIADGNANEIDKVTPSGTLSIVAGNGTLGTPTAGPATSSHLNTPLGVAVNSAGDVFIADEGNNRVEEVTPSGTLSFFAGTGSGGSAPVAGAATSSQTWTPTGVAVDGAGNVYVTLNVPSDIVEITPGGQLSVVAGTGSSGAPTYGGPASASSLNGPVGIYAESDGTLLVADFGNNTIDRIGTATAGAPQDVALTAQGSSAVVSFQAPIDPGSSAITSYQVSLDGGLTWQTITTSNNGGTLSATLSGLTGGTTYNVLVRAVNGSGAGTDSTTASVTIPATSSTTTTSAGSTTTTTGTAPTTTTTTTTTTTSGADEGVTVSAQVADAGVDVSGSGAVKLPLTCPPTPSGCDADGLLTLALTGAGSHALGADAQTPVKDSVLARFAGVEIQSAHGRLVSVKLTPAATRYLQTRGIRRVRVTLTIHNHLSGGPDVTTTQKVWLKIARLEASCPAATGGLTATHIAQMRLGLTHGQAHHLGRYRKAGFGFERYCLTGGAIRVKYPAAKLLRSMSTAQRHQDAGQIYLALTANKHYTAGGVHTGMTVNAARKDLRLGTGVTVGKNTWYLPTTKQGALVLKAQHGIIREIGITRRSLTQTPHARQTLLHNI